MSLFICIYYILSCLPICNVLFLVVSGLLARAGRLAFGDEAYVMNDGNVTYMRCKSVVQDGFM